MYDKINKSKCINTQKLLQQLGREFIIVKFIHKTLEEKI